MSEEIIIKLDHISKKFGSNEVIKDLSLDIRRGDAIALTGHNGVGKSTLLKIMSKLINVTSGNVVFDHNLKISYIPEHFPKLSFTANDFLIHMGLINGMSLEETESRTKELMEQYFMYSMKDTQLRYLSKGTLQKVAVIQALLTKPDVLLLDEPLSGQDIDSQNVFISEINKMRTQGLTIIMSCHEKFLINRLVDTVYQLDPETKTLYKIELNSGKTSEYDILLFDIRNYKGKVQETYRNDIIQISHKPDHKNILKMVVNDTKSNQIIEEMIQSGAFIKEMRHENS